MNLTHLVMFKFLGGASEADAPAAPSFNNSTQNWLSPSLHLGWIVGAFLCLLREAP